MTTSFRVITMIEGTVRGVSFCYQDHATMQAAIEDANYSGGPNTDVRIVEVERYAPYEHPTVEEFKAMPIEEMTVVDGIVIKVGRFGLESAAIYLRDRTMKIGHPVPNWNDLSENMKNRWMLTAAESQGLI